MSAGRVITTARLVMRPHEEADLDELAAMWGDPQVTRYIGGRPSTREEAWGRLLRHVGHWALRGYGYWCVRERAGGAFVGDVGFLDLRREIAADLSAPEAGWVLAPAMHGRGYAREAVAAALAWADARWPETVCLIHHDNARSVQVAAASGYRERERAAYHGEPMIVMTRSRPG